MSHGVTEFFINPFLKWEKIHEDFSFVGSAYWLEIDE